MNITLRVKQADISPTWDRELAVELRDVDENDFLEETIKNLSVRDILDNLDEDDIISYLENRHYTITENE